MVPRLLQVEDLLEPKQQQAGVVQAWQSAKYRDEAMIQGQSIFVFTIVTIIFVSVSPVGFSTHCCEYAHSPMHCKKRLT